MKSQHKILIVENDTLAADYLKILLTKNGYTVAAILTSADEIVHHAHLIKPDLILMDILLDGKKTGCEAAVEIRQNCSHCYIVFLTAHSEKEMVEFAKRSEADGYLLKPYRDDEILATLAVVLSHQRVSKEEGIEEVFFKDGFSFSFKRDILLHRGRHIPLPPQKTALIRLLVKNIDVTVSNEQISQAVWGESRSDGTIRSLVHRFKKITGEELISNVNSIGYVVRTE